MKNQKNIIKIKKLKLPGRIVKSLKDGVVNSDLIIFCTPMSEYKKIILKINKYIKPKSLLQILVLQKLSHLKIIKKFLKKDVHWIQSHPITGSEVSGPENGKDNMFEDKWCILIKDKKTNLKHLKFFKFFLEKNRF